MKKLKITLAAIVAAIGLSGAASAATCGVDATCVGTADTFLGSTDANLNITQELAFLEGLAGTSLTITKIENNTGWTDAILDDGTGTAVDGALLDVNPDQPGFFLVKLGGGNLPAGVDTTYAFRNIAELTLLAVSDDDVNNIFTTFDIDRISHYTVSANIPLPAAGWLMIAGIGGLAALKRKKRAA